MSLDGAEVPECLSLELASRVVDAGRAAAVLRALGCPAPAAGPAPFPADPSAWAQEVAGNLA